MWTNPQETADLVTFTEEIFSEKLHILCGNKYRTIDTQLRINTAFKEMPIQSSAVPQNGVLITNFTLVQL